MPRGASPPAAAGRASQSSAPSPAAPAAAGGAAADCSGCGAGLRQPARVRRSAGSGSAGLGLARHHVAEQPAKPQAKPRTMPIANSIDRRGGKVGRGCLRRRNDGVGRVDVGELAVSAAVEMLIDVAWPRLPAPFRRPMRSLPAPHLGFQVFERPCDRDLVLLARSRSPLPRRRCAQLTGDGGFSILDLGLRPDAGVLRTGGGQRGQLAPPSILNAQVAQRRRAGASGGAPTIWGERLAAESGRSAPAPLPAASPADDR